MKLVNIETSQSLVDFEGEKITFYNKFLESEMHYIGIAIPHGLRGVYNGKDYIHLEDKEFQKAFKEIYYLTTMNSEIFQWED